MNAAQTAKQLAWFEQHKDVMKAFACGEEIEFSSKPKGPWTVACNPTWDPSFHYRVKPKPRTVTLIEAFLNDHWFVYAMFIDGRQKYGSIATPTQALARANDLYTDVRSTTFIEQL